MTAHDILNNPFLNKGTAFILEERKELGLIGLFYSKLLVKRDHREFDEFRNL